jgi:glycosyltransferase involved in cell wall biosynthesis
MRELVYSNPLLVRSWCGGPGALSTKFDSPSWYWSTRVFQQIKDYTENSFVWFAPANFDRPLFLTRQKCLNKVIQVVHDAIPFLHLRGLSFFYALQFRFFVKRVLKKFPHIVCVSKHTGDALKRFSKSRSRNVLLVPHGINSRYGHFKKPRSRYECLQLRRDFSLVKSIVKSGISNESLKSLIESFWSLGVGRSVKYKNWSLAHKASYEFEKNGTKAWFLRIGLDVQELHSYKTKHKVFVFEKGVIIEDLRIVALPKVEVELLSEIYKLSDILLHPSKGEGFGFPPLEAALSGLPVAYRSDTAVSSHFSKDSLPKSYWREVCSDKVEHWVAAMFKMLPFEESDFFQELLSSADVRGFILKKSQMSDYTWQVSAQKLLNSIFNDDGQVNKLFL